MYTHPLRIYARVQTGETEAGEPVYEDTLLYELRGRVSALTGQEREFLRLPVDEQAYSVIVPQLEGLSPGHIVEDITSGERWDIVEIRRSFATPELWLTCVHRRIGQ